MIAKSVAILIAGKAGTGKTTTANYLHRIFKEDYGEDSGIAPFAWGLKGLAKQMFWDGKKDDKGRKLLQDLGKIGREYDISTWAKWTYTILAPNMTSGDGLSLLPVPIVITDDWRFPDEIDYIKGLGIYDVVAIRIDAPEREELKETEYYNHVSETALDDFNKFDFFIDNSGSLEQLEKNCMDICWTIYNKAKKYGGFDGR